MILACLDTQRIPLNRGGELSAAVRQILPFITFGVAADECRGKMSAESRCPDAGRRGRCGGHDVDLPPGASAVIRCGHAGGSAVLWRRCAHAIAEPGSVTRVPPVPAGK